MLFPYKLVIGKTSRDNVVQDTPPHTNATLINTNLITPTHNENIINTPNNPHMNFPQVSRNVSNERGANNRGNWLTGLRIMWRRVRTILSRDTPHSRLQKSTNPRRERYLQKGNWKFTLKMWMTNKISVDILTFLSCTWVLFNVTLAKKKPYWISIIDYLLCISTYTPTHIYTRTNRLKSH